jgi:hypothetical protein
VLLVGKGAEIPDSLARQYGLGHLAEQGHEPRESATLRQMEAARARGAIEEIRALEARLPADRAADEADPDHTRRLTGGPAEIRAQERTRAVAAAAGVPVIPPATGTPRLTADEPVHNPNLTRTGPVPTSEVVAAGTEPAPAPAEATPADAEAEEDNAEAKARPAPTEDKMRRPSENKGRR